MNGSLSATASPSSLQSPPARRSAAFVATVGWVALSLQLIVTVSMMTRDGHSVLAAVWRYLGFFTILTNLLVATTMTAVARGRRPGGVTPDASALAGVVLAIAVVGVVYHVLLAATVPPMAPLWWTADRLLHYVVPTLSVLWWFVYAPKGALGWRDPWRWLVFPVGYLLYAMARGLTDGWYPYYFIDVSALGYGGALGNAAGLSAALVVVGHVVVGLVRVTARRGR